MTSWLGNRGGAYLAFLLLFFPRIAHSATVHKVGTVNNAVLELTADELRSCQDGATVQLQGQDPSWRARATISRCFAKTKRAIIKVEAPPTPLTVGMKLTWKVGSLAASGTVAATSAANLSSELIREKRRRGLGLRAGLGVVGSIPGVGLEAWYASSSRWQWGGLVEAGALDLAPELQREADIRIERFLLTGALALGQARYFWGNSFFVSALIGGRQIHGSYAFADDSGNALLGDINVVSGVVGLGLGNLWSWDNGVFFGGQWAGLVVPIYSSATVTTTTEGAVSALIHDIQTEADALGKSIGEKQSEQRLHLIVGYHW